MPLYTAQLTRQHPCLCLIDPHQRRVHHEPPLHAEIERDLQSLDRVGNPDSPSNPSLNIFRGGFERQRIGRGSRERSI
jgi:hypothetical protein